MRGRNHNGTRDVVFDARELSIEGIHLGACFDVESCGEGVSCILRVLKEVELVNDAFAGLLAPDSSEV